MSKKDNVKVNVHPVASSDTRTVGGSVSVSRGADRVEVGAVRSGQTTIFHGNANKQVTDRTSIHVSGSASSNGYREGRIGVGFKF